MGSAVMLEGDTVASGVARRRTPSAPTLTAIVLTLAGIGVRLWALTSTSQRWLNGDEAVTGIMVRRILAGQNQYVFFAGQEYNGSLEQYLQAGMYAVLRLPQNTITLRFAQIGLMAAVIWLTYIVGCRLLERPWAAVLAAGLIAFGPFWTFARGLHTYGAYPSLIVVGLLGIYCSLRIGERGWAGLGWAAGLGFTAGLIGWLGLSGVELLIPAAFLAAPTFFRSWRPWVFAILGGIVGLSPLLAWSVRHGDFALLNAGPPVRASTAGQRLHNLFGPVLREFVGVGQANGAPGWPLTLQYLLVGVLAVAYVVAVVRRRHSILTMLSLKTEGRSPFDALLLAIPVLVVIYGASKWAWVATEPRYLFAFSPVLVWCLAAALPKQPRPARLTAVLAGAAVFAATSIAMLANRPYVPAAYGQQDLQAASSYLRANNELNGYADYWTAMPLLYAADGTINVAPLSTGRNDFPAITAAVDAAPDIFYAAGSPTSTAQFGGAWLEKQLRDHHVTYHKVVFGQVVVLDQLKPELRPWQLGIGWGPSS